MIAYPVWVSVNLLFILLEILFLLCGILYSLLSNIYTPTFIYISIAR